MVFFLIHCPSLDLSPAIFASDLFPDSEPSASHGAWVLCRREVTLEVSEDISFRGVSVTEPTLNTSVELPHSFKVLSVEVFNLPTFNTRRSMFYTVKSRF